MVFHGSEQETRELLAATENSCADPEPCRKDPKGKVVQVCAAHRALLEQRFLDGILWTRHGLAERRREEWD